MFTDEHHQEIADLLTHKITSEEELERLDSKLLDYVKFGEAFKYLYVIRCVGSDYYKIGITNDVDKRIRQHQTGCPYKLKHIMTFESDFEDPYGREISYLESFLHQNYRHLRVRGEWFELSYQHLSDIMYFLAQIRELTTRYDESAEELAVFAELFKSFAIE